VSRIAGAVMWESGARAMAARDLLGRQLARPGRFAPTAELGPMAAVALGGAVLAQTPRYLLVMDGTIFNRADWQDLVPESAGPEDAAALLALIESKGLDRALDRVNGDFSLALYNHDSRRLTLVRDRMGLRPLFWAKVPGGIAFASQPRALAALPSVGAEPNRRWLAVYAGCHYRAIDNQPAESPYAHVGQVPAAHVLVATAAAIEPARRWWDLVPREPLAGSADELAEAYRDLILDAVKVRVAQSKRPAFTLSGGLDSSSVLSAAVEFTGEKQHAFSSVYTDKTYDESDEIKSMLDDKVSQWHQVPVGDSPDVFGLVGEMLEANDEPIATATWLSHWVLTRQVAQDGFTHLFGGLGGDELNAGEFEYFFFHFADLKQAGRTADLTREISGWQEHHDHPVWKKNPEVALKGIERFTEPGPGNKVRTDLERLRRYHRAIQPGWTDLGSYLPVLDHPFPNWLLNRTYQDLVRETTPCCLRAEDRHCSARGLIRFDPFLDHRLAEFMFRVPGDLKIKDGVTKQLLRRAMKGILPEETRTRIAKVGWNAPAHVWFAQGKGLDQIRDLIGSQSFRDNGLFDVDEVARILDEHLAILADPTPRDHHMMFLWQMVNAALWLQGKGRLPKAI